MKLLSKEEYAEFFGKDSRAEVPVFGKVEGEIVSAQIDRLVVQEDRIVIIDFKTNKLVPESADEIPDLYKRQLEIYEKLICAIYPKRKIESYILWTNKLRLMQVL